MDSQLDMLQWLDVTQMTPMAQDALVDLWPNLSRNGQSGPSHYLTSVQPKYQTAANGINGKPALWFDGIDDQLTYFEDILAGATAATVFVVAKLENDPPSIGLSPRFGFWSFGTAPDPALVPYSDGVIYDEFCSTTRKTTANPSDSMASPFLYNVVSGPGDWRNYLNGTLLYSTASNTFGHLTECDIGIARRPGPVALHGRLGEFLLYDSVLSEGKRLAVQAQLMTKWGI